MKNVVKVGLVEVFGFMEQPPAFGEGEQRRLEALEGEGFDDVVGDA
mgnify:CR=1 FL=1